MAKIPPLTLSNNIPANPLPRALVAAAVVALASSACFPWYNEVVTCPDLGTGWFSAPTPSPRAFQLAAHCPAQQVGKTHTFAIRNPYGVNVEAKITDDGCTGTSFAMPSGGFASLSYYDRVSTAQSTMQLSTSNPRYTVCLVIRCWTISGSGDSAIFYDAMFGSTPSSTPSLTATRTPPPTQTATRTTSPTQTATSTPPPAVVRLVTYSSSCPIPSFCDQLCAQTYVAYTPSGGGRPTSVYPAPRTDGPSSCTCSTPVITSGSSTRLTMSISTSVGAMTVTLSRLQGRLDTLTASIVEVDCTMTYAVVSGTVLGARRLAPPVGVLLTRTAISGCGGFLDACNQLCSASYVYESYASLSVSDYAVVETYGTLLPATVAPSASCRCYTPVITARSAGSMSGVLAETGTQFSAAHTAEGTTITFPSISGCSLRFVAPPGVTVAWPQSVAAPQQVEAKADVPMALVAGATAGGGVALILIIVIVSYCYCCRTSADAGKAVQAAKPAPPTPQQPAAPAYGSALPPPPGSYGGAPPPGGYGGAPPPPPGGYSGVPGSSGSAPLPPAGGYDGALYGAPSGSSPQGAFANSNPMHV